jgi:nicotinate-nucleotide pyrophosphorylase (carboxylating)
MKTFESPGPGAARPSRQAVLPIVAAALAEDIGPLDITTEVLVPAGATASGRLLCKADGIVCGLWVCELVFAQLSPDIRFQPLVEEASPVTRGQELAAVTGPARAILAGERVALNFLQRLSGIATMAHQAASAVEGTRTRVLDTRKTTPGLRILEKWAVRAGGASNHRFGLFDMVLIKDNHILLAGGIGAAIAAARRNASPMVKVEVECADLKQVKEALEAGADVIMLDNMDVTAMGRAVALINGRALVEASGGITVATLPEVAKTGVDFASMGALTHSYRSLDISLELQPLGETPPAGG